MSTPDLQRTSSALRKIGHFAAAMFPALARAWQRLEERLAARWLRSRGAARWARVKDSRAGAAVGRVLRRLYWKDYAKDRVVWSAMPPEGAAVLRPAFLACLVLCVTAPVAMLAPWPAVRVAAREGAAPVAVAAWSVALWPVAFALAWSALLAGAAAANRLLSAVACGTFAYAAFAYASALPRSYASVAAPLALLVATAATERQQRRPGGMDVAAGLATAVLQGLALSLPLGGLTPVGRSLGMRPLHAGVVVGVPLALVAWAWGRGAVLRGRAPRGDGGALTLPRSQRVLFVALAAFVGSAVARWGAARAAGELLPTLSLLVYQLWPLWYFVGVGVIFKLLSTARTVAGALRGALTDRWLPPFVLLALLAGTLLLWAPAVFEYARLPWPAWARDGAEWLYRAGRGWLWAHPQRRLVAEPLRWVVLAASVAAVVQAARRRLDATTAASIAYQCLIGWLVVFEYVREARGFARSAPHSALAILVFAGWLLWLLHDVGLQVASRASPRWPAPARIALLAGLLPLVLLEVHARAALRDDRVTDEMYLYLFLGVVDVGLPFALYVWAGRSLPRLPVSSTALLGAFALGAAGTLPIAVLDKLAAVGGSARALGGELDARVARFFAGDAGALDAWAAPSDAWIAARGAVALAAFALAGAWLDRRHRARPEGRATVVTLLLAAAAGFASFSRIRVLLPFAPARWSALVSPAGQSLTFDAHLVASYLAWGEAVLVLALVAFGPAGTRARPAAGFAAAYALHLVVALAWPAREAWLRGAGVLAPAAVAGVALFAALIATARYRIEGALTGAAASAPAARRAWIAAGGAIALAAAAGAYRGWDARLVPRRVGGLAAPLPSAWTPVASAPGGVTTFRRSSWTPVVPVLFAAAERAPADGPRALLARRVGALAPTLPGFAPQRADRWGPSVAGGALVDYRFELRLGSGVAMPVMATSAVIPAPGGTVLLVTLVASVDDWEAWRWDLPRVAEALAAR